MERIAWTQVFNSPVRGASITARDRRKSPATTLGNREFARSKTGPAERFEFLIETASTVTFHPQHSDQSRPP